MQNNTGSQYYPFTGTSNCLLYLYFYFKIRNGNWAYSSFYSWPNIYKASGQHDKLMNCVKHFAYAGGWKKFEPLWNFMIKTQGLNKMLPLLESILSQKEKGENKERRSFFPAIA